MLRRTLLTAALTLGLTSHLAGCGSDDTSGSGGSTATGGSGGSTATGGSGGQTTTSETNDPRFDPLIAAVEAERKALGAPGVAIAVLEDGKVTFARGFGSKDPNGDDPVKATTLFRTGSVNKMLTAAALLRQVAAGKVNLDHPVTEYVPEFHFTLDATWAPSILVKDLLRQTSGMYDYLEIDVPPNQQQDSALAAFLTGSFADKDFLMAPAGAFWNYSNPNYMVAGLVAETASGKTYRQLMKDEVFAPLGMDRTFFLGSEVIADGDFALGKTSFPNVDDPVHPDSYDNAWARPAGYATSNVLDLAKFTAFLLDGDEAVLPDALRAEMQSKVVDMQTRADLQWYGYGLFSTAGVFLGSQSEYYEMPIVHHGGDIPGFAADVMLVPSLRSGIVVMANADGAHFIQSIVTAFKTLAPLPEPSTPPVLVSDPGTYGALEGVYQDDINVGEIDVTKVGDELHVSMPLVDQAGIPYDAKLVPLEGVNFVLNIQGTSLQVTFIADETGTSRYFRTRAFVGTRPAAPPPPAPPALEGARREALLAAIRRARPTLEEALIRPSSP